MKRPIHLSHYFWGVILVCFLALVLVAPALAEEEKIDASDPTKIYTYAGGGVKYTDYTNGEYMWEIRATGNIGLSKSDMVMFELGYGWHSGDLVDGKNQGLTNARLRWFHLFPMNYSVTSGYRGWGTQVDMQLAGALKGTDGQNTISLGAIPAFGLSENWSFYLPVNLINTWDKNFKQWNGMGIGASPLLVYAPDKWWPGAYVQLWPNYAYFFTGDLKNDGSGNIDVTTGGEITSTVLWALTFQKNVDVDLNSFRRGRDTGLKNDWNMFFNITMYF